MDLSGPISGAVDRLAMNRWLKIFKYALVVASFLNLDEKLPDMMNYFAPKNKLYFIAVFFLFSFSALKAESSKNWPREIESKDGKITIFQPEIESLSNDKMESRSAVIIEIKDKSTPVFGAIWYECRISTDRDARTVTLLDMTIVADKFPGIDGTEVKEINSYVEQEVPKWEMVMSLDDILAGLEFNEQVDSISEKLDNDAPEIIFATTPTALISIDGNPVFKKIEKTAFDYVVNTPFFIAKDQESGILYLKGGDYWYTSNDIYKGWKVSDNIPKKLLSLESESADQQNTQQEAKTNSDEAVLPEIIVRTAPAEILLSNGSPKYSSIEKTSLLYMTNTDDDILMDINTQYYYVLISGRWYKSKNLNSNDWTFVSPDALPEDFSNIPTNSPMSSVRASVAGTQESKEAVLETKIPQTAEIDREAATLEVTYDGDPVFEKIAGTGMLYAVNTAQSVLLIGNTYYCCDHAVWFESTSPTGPWDVCIKIPEDIMNIPPECPVYNVKYVFIYDYTSSVVHVGYMQGYVQDYIYKGCVFYGTGYDYDSWYGTCYYPRPVTYGFSVHYNSFSGWGFSYGVSYGGYNWMDYGDRYHSSYSGYWGSAGYRHGYYRGASFENKRGYADRKPISPGKEGKKAGSLQERRIATNNVYLNRNNGITRTGDSQYNPKTGKKIAGSSSSVKQAQTSKRSNNLYSDKTGNVYKRSSNGKWETQKNNKTGDTTTGTTSATSKFGRTSDSDVQKEQSTTTTNKQATPKQQTTAKQQTDRDQTKTSSARPSDSGKQTQSTAQSNRQTSSAPNAKTTQSTTQSLNSQYNSRVRSNERTETYTKNKTQNQYTQPNSASTQNRSSSNAATTTSPSRSMSQPATGKTGTPEKKR
jgi:hypothetical protein